VYKFVGHSIVRTWRLFEKREYWE